MGNTDMKFEQAGTTNDPLMAEAAQLRASPAFCTALREYTVAIAQFREAPRLLNKLIASETRFRLLSYLLYLDSDQERFGAQGGASYSRLLELRQSQPELSPRVIKTMLALLQVTGFIRVARPPTDRRAKTYRPTPRMLDFSRRWMPHAVNALDVLQPERQRARAFAQDPEAFIRKFVTLGGREHTAGVPLIDRMPEFTGFFGKREGAIPVVLAVMLSDMDKVSFPSRTQIASRFGLSKTQVSKLMAEGVCLGFFEIDARGIPSATPHLRDSYSKWISIELAFYARHMQ